VGNATSRNGRLFTGLVLIIAGAVVLAVGSVIAGAIMLVAGLVICGLVLLGYSSLFSAARGKRDIE
jgi:hypothetical protein